VILLQCCASEFVHHFEMNDSMRRFLNSAETAAVLGVSVRQVRRLVARNLLPPTQFGRKHKWLKTDIEAFAKAHPRSSRGRKPAAACL
jgi:excisionase family DNA binding protein